MSDIITFFINKFDGGVERIKKSFNLFIMSLSHGVSSFDDKDKIFEGSANTLKHRYKYERLHMYIHYTHLKGASYYAFIWYRHAMHPLYLVFV